MQPKPVHLGRNYAEQFQDTAVAAAYHHRPPYPAETIDILLELIVDSPRRALDIGAGTGAIARALAGRVDRVDAVDPSTAMIERGCQLPGGDHPGLHWIEGTAETAPLDPPYALITAAASLHWMEWEIVLPRMREALTPNGRFAIVGQPLPRGPWSDALQAVIDRYSTNRDYQPYNVITELTQRSLFHETGRRQTASASFQQSVADFVESFHARNGFSRDRMPEADAAAFDREATAVIQPCATDGSLTLETQTVVIWGQPAPR